MFNEFYIKELTTLYSQGEHANVVDQTDLVNDLKAMMLGIPSIRFQKDIHYRFTKVALELGQDDPRLVGCSKKALKPVLDEMMTFGSNISVR